MRRSCTDDSSSAGFDRWTMIASVSAAAVGCAATRCVARQSPPSSAAPARMMAITVRGIAVSEHENQLRADRVNPTLSWFVGMFVLRLETDPLHRVEPDADDVRAVRAGRTNERRRRIDGQAIVPIVRPPLSP